MKLIKLSRPDGSEVYVNPNHVVSAAAADKPGHTHLTLAGAMQVVIGDLEEVISCLTHSSDC